MVGAVIRDRWERYSRYKEQYAAWLSSLDAGDLARVRAMGLERPVHEQFGRVSRDESAMGLERPVAAPVVVDLPPRDTGMHEGCLGMMLSWCLVRPAAVQIGWRVLAVMAVQCPELLAGAEPARDLVDEWRAVGWEEPAGFQAVWEWLRRGRRVGQVGQRMLVLVYVVCPGMGGRTLDDIGRMSGGKTRQAIDRLVGDFRDTFGGIKSRSMRGEDNRLRCRQAHHGMN